VRYVRSFRAANNDERQRPLLESTIPKLPRGETPNFPSGWTASHRRGGPGVRGAPSVRADRPSRASVNRDRDDRVAGRAFVRRSTRWRPLVASAITSRSPSARWNDRAG
jgi:hypothetical protein